MKKQAKKLLTGLSIGDGYISKNGNSYCLEIQHSIKQLDYLKYKVELIEKILGIKVDIKISYADKAKKYKRCRIRVYHPYLKYLHRQLYKKGKKVIDIVLLNKIDLLGLSLIYMDDGSRTIIKKYGRTQGSVNIYISTMFNLASSTLLTEYFKKKFDVQFKLERIGTKSYYRLRCGVIEGRKLQLKLKPFLIPSMMYKLDFI